MKNMLIVSLSFVVLMLTGCYAQEELDAYQILPSGQMYLFGEIHSDEAHLNKQLELWRGFYTYQNMRHLFVEMPFFTAEFLNIWMQEEDDYILDGIFADARGTALDSIFVREFLQAIKRELPETVFHGTDVGHQHNTTGQRFLQYLRENGLEDSELYILTLENIEQGRRWNSSRNFRTESMVQNFVRAFDALEGESIMSAFYGAAHVAWDYFGGIQTLAARLREIYGENVHAVDLRELMEPDRLTIAGVEYIAIFFGSQDMSGWHDEFVQREFWRIEDSYEDFRDNPTTGDMLPFDNFPMPVDLGQVFAIRMARRDGSYSWNYYRSSGAIWDGRDSTEEFLVED